jgi:hypothetical protein
VAELVHIAMTSSYYADAACGATMVEPKNSRTIWQIESALNAVTGQNLDQITCRACRENYLVNNALRRLRG